MRNIQVTRRPWLALMSTTLLMSVLLTGCSQPETTEQAAPAAKAMPVKVQSLSMTNVIEWDEFTGRFAASKRVDVQARVSGFIESVAFKDGQQITAGDVLYELDKRPFEIALSSASAQLKLAEKEMDRGRNLVRNNSISQEQLDERLNQLQVAQASFDQAKLDLEFATVTAPISGRIDRTYVNEGNLVVGGNSAGNVLTSIVALDPIHFYFSGSEGKVLNYIRQRIVNNGVEPSERAWPVYVKLQDEKSFMHKGSMDFTANAMDVDSGTMQARATFPNPDRLIQDGMFGRLRISPREDYEAIVISDELVMSERARKYVYVVDAENRAEKRYVELGGLDDSGMRIVNSGLTVADKIVVGNLQMLRTGMQLKPIMSEGGE